MSKPTLYDQWSQARHPVQNKASEDIPAYGVIRVTGITDGVFQGNKPDGTNADCTFWVNLPQHILDANTSAPDGQVGFCTRQDGCYALYESSDGTPVAGEEWGPDNDWKLHKGKEGFVIVGGETGTGEAARVRVQAKGGGSGAASITGLFGLVITNIPKANDFDFSTKLESTPAFNWEVEPGIALDSGTEVLNVWQMDWERNNADAAGWAEADYVEPFRKLRPVVEQEGESFVVRGFAGINLSKTDIRASKAEPVLVTGFRYSLLIEGTRHEWFVISNVMDFRALPGFLKGDEPVSTDDPDLQIPYHSGGDNSFTLDSTDCAGGGS